MSKYADVENLIKKIKNISTEDNYRYDLASYMAGAFQIRHQILKLIETEPSADVQEVKYGKWVKNKDNGYIVCSNCKSTKPYDGIAEEDPERVVYWVCRCCPSCGAKMDGVEDLKTMDNGYQPKQEAENNEESYYSTAFKIACIILEKEKNFIKEYGKLPQIVTLNGFQKETLTTEYGEEEYFYSAKKLDYFCGLKILTSPQINEAGDIEVR